MQHSPGSCPPFLWRLMMSVLTAGMEFKENKLLASKASELTKMTSPSTNFLASWAGDFQILLASRASDFQILLASRANDFQILLASRTSNSILLASRSSY